jgi:hypothetical protein
VKRRASGTVYGAVACLLHLLLRALTRPDRLGLLLPVVSRLVCFIPVVTRVRTSSLSLHRLCRSVFQAAMPSLPPHIPCSPAVRVAPSSLPLHPPTTPNPLSLKPLLSLWSHHDPVATPLASLWASPMSRHHYPPVVTSSWSLWLSKNTDPHTEPHHPTARIKCYGDQPTRIDYGRPCHGSRLRWNMVLFFCFFVIEKITLLLRF